MCEHYKPLLVEEIALAHPESVYLGKCSVIGQLADHEDQLRSLSIPDLPSDMYIPDGSCSVYLDFENYIGLIPRKKHVEVSGIVKSTLGTDRTDYVPSGCSTSEANQEQVYVFISVEYMSEVESARDLIVSNLKMRKLKWMALILPF